MRWDPREHLLSTHADRHVVDISFTVCYPHMPIGMLWIYRLLFVCLFVFFCLSAGILVTDIPGTDRRRAMKFCRLVDLGVRQKFSSFGELWPRG